MELNDPGEPPYGKLQFAAIGIRSENSRQLHVAVLYRALDKSVRVLHFCGHGQWVDDSVVPELAEHDQAPFLWVRPNVRDSVMRSLAAQCRRVASVKSLDGMPYGFHFDPTTHFDERTGAYVAPKNQGLTCATFVIALFSSVSVKLFDFPNWPNRPCDIPWQKRMVRRQKNQDLSAQIGAARFRPEEVVAASVQTNRPGPARSIVRGGRDIAETAGAPDGVCYFDL